MAKRQGNTGPLTPEEIQRAFDQGGWARQFPPVLSVSQAAQLAHVPRKTIYDWSSRGLLSGCAARRGKWLRVWRGRFIAFLFHELNDDGG